MGYFSTFHVKHGGTASFADAKARKYRPEEVFLRVFPRDRTERLLGEAMNGDATLFARQDVVEAAWAIVDPLLAAPGPMFEYEPGSWGPPQAERLVADVGGWNTPQ